MPNSNNVNRSYKIIIKGRVQGVGFRPHVYRLATKLGLKGSVSNNENGVIIYLNGNEKQSFRFYESLIENPPSVSKITEHHFCESEPVKFDSFKIVPSGKNSKLNLQLTPDFGICEDCKKELVQKDNRRYNYPFTTCVNCGPRWAITNSFPFEREHTNMKDFEMCPHCQNEYSDPGNRRFHSQTNSCPQCGPELVLTDSKGSKINEDSIMKRTARLIKEGKLIAIKNNSGYLLCCDANNREAIQRLRSKKKRPSKPFAILYPSLSKLKKDLLINRFQENALTSCESPIVLIPLNNFEGELALKDLAPNLDHLGVMLPYSGILQNLITEIGIPVVATSGNIHGSPILSSTEIAMEELSDVADYFLNHNLYITNPQDDSVVKFSRKFNQKVIFRRSRGYSPNFDAAVKSKEKIMAMGAHLKSTIAFLPNDYLYISQYLGNLDNFNVYDRYMRTVIKFTELFEQLPEVILTDMHPNYHSTRFGRELSEKWEIEYFQIQHHKAHFAAVLDEHQLFKNPNPILGVVWDGTGYGEDAQIWGGEFFKFESGEMERLDHFEYFDWLAGDKMAREPRLSFLSLSNVEMQKVIEDKFSKEETAVYNSLKSKNSLKTSSVGRII